jgi:hypothetical protein
MATDGTSYPLTQAVMKHYRDRQYWLQFTENAQADTPENTRKVSSGAPFFCYV